MVCDVVEGMSGMKSVVEDDSGESVEVIVCRRGGVVGWEGVVVKSGYDMMGGEGGVIGVV